MSTGETLLIVAVVGVVAYLVYQNNKAPGPLIEPGVYGPAPAPAPGKYDFYGKIADNSRDVVQEAIRAFSGSGSDTAARTAP